jgi:DNA-binding MarR family transcriptional regulator
VTSTAAKSARPSAPQDDFVAAWESFFKAVNRARGRAGRVGEGELTLAQFNLLEPLATTSALPAGVLAEEAGVSAPSATRMLDALTRVGHVRRTTDGRDRRVVLVSLTAPGSAALARRREAVEATRRRIHDSLAPDERELAAGLLRRLSDVLDQQA